MLDGITRLRLPRHRVDTIAATIGFLIAALLFPLRYLASELFVEAIPIILGISSILYLISCRHGRESDLGYLWTLDRRSTILIRNITFVALSGLASIGMVLNGRTASFFVLAAAVGMLIFVQIFLTPDALLRPKLILAEILVFAMIVRFVAVWTTPGLIGVDMWTHITTYAEGIKQSGSIEAIADSKYSAAPLYHLFVVVASMAFDISLRNALYVSLGVVLVLCVLFVYVTARQLLGIRWALFATASYAVADQVVRWGIHIIPTSVGLVFYLAIFYCVTKLFNTDRRTPIYGLLLIFGLAVVLTHQISAFITLLFLGSGVLAQFLFRGINTQSANGDGPFEKDANLLGVFVVVAGITLGVWSMTPYRSSSFLTTMIGTFKSAVTTSAGFLNLVETAPPQNSPAASVVTTPPQIIELFDAIGFFLLLLLAALGMFVFLRSDRLGQLSLTYIFSTGIMLVMIFGLPLFGLNLFIPGRWYAFFYTPLVVAGAFGIRHLALRFGSQSVLIGMLMFALIFPGAMLISHKATPDNPVFDESYSRFAYTESELAAAETLDVIIPDKSTLRTDHPYRTVLLRWQGQNAKPILITESGTVKTGPNVYRDYLSSGVAKAKFGDGFVPLRLDENDVCRSSDDRVYTNGDVRYCPSPPAPLGVNND